MSMNEIKTLFIMANASILTILVPCVLKVYFNTCTVCGINMASLLFLCCCV